MTPKELQELEQLGTQLRDSMPPVIVPFYLAMVKEGMPPEGALKLTIELMKSIIYPNRP